MSDAVVFKDEAGNIYSQNQVQGQGNNSQFSFPPMAQQRSDKADLLDKIRPDAIVEILRQKLMGKEYWNGKWVAVPALQSRAISEVGAWDISNLMLSASSQNVSLTKLTDDEIRTRCLNIVRTVQYMLLRNWREYGIIGTDQLHFVHEIVMTNTLVTLKQPENGGIRDLIKGTTSENIIHSSALENQKKWSFFGRR